MGFSVVISTGVSEIDHERQIGRSIGTGHICETVFGVGRCHLRALGHVGRCDLCDFGDGRERLAGTLASGEQPNITWYPVAASCPSTRVPRWQTPAWRQILGPTPLRPVEPSPIGRGVSRVGFRQFRFAGRSQVLEELRPRLQSGPLDDPADAFATPSTSYKGLQAQRSLDSNMGLFWRSTRLGCSA